jgi:hypothetical protein
MVRIIRHFPATQPNDTDSKPLFDEEGPLFSASAEDKLDNLIAGLTRRPNVAPAHAAAANATPANVAANEPAGARLPSVEEFHFDETAARNMASKLAPDKKPRVKNRRLRYRSPNRDRWQLPDELDERDEFGGEHNADSPKLPKAVTPPRGGRGLFWSFCASILVIVGTSAAFGFVEPLNNLLPKRMGLFLGGLSEELGTNLRERADTSADVEVAGGNPNSDKDLLIPDRPAATAAVARPVSTTTITADVRPPESNGDSGIVKKVEARVAAAGQPYDLGTTVLKLGAVDGAAAEFEKPKSATPAMAAESATPPVAETPAAAPEKAPAATSEAAPDEGSKGSPRKPVLQQTAKLNPLQLTNTTPAITPEPAPSASSAELPVTSSLTAGQIDRLLARGNEMLQAGDIASARLLFQRIAAAGDRRGAMGVGMTYDPRVYARLPVTGLTPDREQAEYWYKKAGGGPTFTTNLDNAADTRKSQGTASAEWNAACARKYNSFDPSTGLYTARSGSKRPCKLP